MRARVLELGCGDGGNLLSLAQALPGATFLGIDAAAGAVARGRALAEAAELQNVELRVGDLEELAEVEGLAEGLGRFDYILSHGVYSWIPPRARVGLLAGARRHLAAEGVAYVSYNAYPGSYLRDMARDILGFHVREIADPTRKLVAAQELMRTIVAIEEPSPYARVLREHMERMLRYSDALLFHDDLAEVSTPFYFHEFMEHAAHHGLAFLSEADLFESQMRDVPQAAEELMAGLPDDVVVREQYLDFFKNRMFRQTLLCHADAPVTRSLDVRQVERFAACSQARAEGAEKMLEGVHAGRAPDHEPSPPAGFIEEDAPTHQTPSAMTFTTPEGFSMTTSEPLVIAAMRALADAWPAALEFPALLEYALDAAGPQAPRELVGERLRTVLLQAYLARILVLRGSPPPLVTHPGERPLASPLARAQLTAGLPMVSSLLHSNARLDGELAPQLLPLLDGSRDVDALASALRSSPEQVRAALGRFASLGLLLA